MSRVCELTGAKANNGMAVSSIQKVGLDKFAKSNGVDLKKF